MLSVHVFPYLQDCLALLCPLFRSASRLLCKSTGCTFDVQQQIFQQNGYFNQNYRVIILLHSQPNGRLHNLLTFTKAKCTCDMSFNLCTEEITMSQMLKTAQIFLLFLEILNCFHFSVVLIKLNIILVKQIQI